MSQEKQDQEPKFTEVEDYIKAEWFNGNRDAVKIVLAFINIAHTWDDLIDGEPAEPELINKAFYDLLVTLPINPLWQAVQSEAIPLIVAAISAWHCANRFEKEGEEHGLEISHILRYHLGQVFILLSIATCGWDEHHKHAPSIWRMVVAERFRPYREEHHGC